MSESNEVPVAEPSSSHPTPPPMSEPLPPPAPRPQTSGLEEGARGRIVALEREAKAMGADPNAALLFHEIGRLWEDPLKNPRNAAVAYQNAFKIAPKFLANIRAARRLFADVGNWLMVVQLIDAELSATEEPRPRSALLLEKAGILEERLSRDEEAAKVYQDCIALQPSDPPVLFQLESVFSAKADHATLVEVYKLLAAALNDDALRAHYLTSAGLLLESRLNDPAAAAVCLREAFASDRRNPLLLSAMMRVAEREDRVEELLSALAAEAELLGPQAAPTYLRISKVYEKLGRKDDALSALLAARRVSPKEPLVLSELAQIYESQARHEDLADILGAWLDAATDESERVALNLRLAALYEESLKRDTDAIQRYKSLLQDVPGHGAALAGLGKLYYRTQNWEGLVQAYDAEIASTSDAKQQAARMYKAAEVLEERLSRQEEAIQRYNRCLQLQPGYLPAQKALTRLYEKQNRHAELVAMYEQDLLQTSDRDQIISTLNKIAQLYEERLGDVDHAVDALKRILELAPDHLATLRNLARLLERASRWADLIQVHDTESAMVGDTKQVLSLHHRNAEILEDHLKDRPGAVAAYERVLQLSPSYLPALKALGRLYAQEERWNDLIRMYRAEAEIAPSTDQAAALIYKIGELYEQRIKSESDALASYQEVLTLAPSYFPALRALGRLYRAQGAWESVIEVLRSEAANRANPVERANALFQAAAIWEDQLNRVDQALEGYQEVLRLTPGHAASIRALERLYTTRNDLRELIAVIDRETQTGQTSGQKVSAYLKLAYIYLDRLNDAARAATCAENALALDSVNVTALKVLERVRATDRVRRAEVRHRLAETVRDPGLRSALRLTAAADADLAETEGAFADLKAAFAANPGDPRLALACERALKQAADWPGSIEVLRARRDAVTEATEKLELTLRIAELAEDKLGDAKQALEAYREALQASPGLILALQGIRRCCAELEDWGGAREALEQEGKGARDVQGAIHAFVAAGQIAAEKLKDPDGAIANFRKALERDPLDPDASRGIEGILAQSGGAADLATLQERRAEAKLAQKDLPAAAAEFLHAARTYLEKLQDSTRAGGMVDRALAAQPTYPDALELKGSLAFAAQSYAEAAAAFALRIQQGGEASMLAKLHLTLGGIYQDHLNDMSRASAHLQTALLGDGTNPEALERLAAIHTVSRNWTGAADCLKRLLDVEPNPSAQAKHTLALARIFDEGLGDAQEASVLYKKALALAPGDEPVLNRLVEIYERMGNLPELVALLEQQAQHAGSGPRAVQLRTKIADIHARSGEAPKAIAAYRQVVDMDANFAPAHAALADLYMRDAAAAPMAIEEHRHLIRLDPARHDSFHALFRLWEGLRQNDKAFCSASILSLFRATNDIEAAFYTEGKNHLPQDLKGAVDAADLQILMHPGCRGSPFVDVLHAVGDQLSKVYPPQFEQLGVDRKADRLKPDHAVHKAIRTIAQLFAVEDFEVYQSRRGLVSLETTDPLAVLVSQDVVRKFNAREQKFLIGRAVFGLLNKTAVLAKLGPAELVDLFGNSIRIFQPDYMLLGRRNDESSKQLRKAYSRKALKALEGPATEAAAARGADLPRVMDGLTHSANRAGLVLCGDVASALNVLLREETGASTIRPDATESIAQAVRSRSDIRELLAFSVSEDFFRLRQKMGVGLV
jgi:tetratricopeptide (TPR) repeat protein